MIRNDANRGPYRKVIEAATAVQEQNVRIAMDTFGMLAGQAGASRALLEHSRARQEALLSLAEGSFEAYSGLFYGHVPKEEAAPAGGDVSEVPIDGYDRLGVEELGPRLEGLCVGDVERLKDYERHTRNRHAVMERLDRALV